ncbi:hypothetical protein CJF30_00004127 [Rutstroemia sp. NJR-2017a BBW]|nr:hypothetical protein CJF30_00004127 [Rutstroemia sp. NJR-2017a BBW]
MGGLIHLKLQPMERNPILPIYSTPSDITSASSPALSSQKSRPKPIFDLLLFPYTQEEWRFVMEQVKRLYVDREYKQCAARCKQILDSIKDPYRIHPLHSLYISFYCATCLEITASSLHNNAPQKLSILQDALTYYQKAESYIPFAEIPTTSHSRAGSRSSSTSSSVRSSVDSVFSSALSSASTADTLSPLISSCSPFYEEDERTPSRKRTVSVSSAMSARSDITSDDPFKPAPLRVRKKVSFSTQPPTLITSDSCTPLPPQETPFPAHLFALTTSLTNYTLTLSSLASQIHYHTTHIQTLIDAILSLRKSRRSNPPSFAPSLFNSSSEDLSLANKELRKKKEIRERVQRLKAQGWPRRRWDAERYERLREKAEREMSGGGYV